MEQELGSPRFQTSRRAVLSLAGAWLIHGPMGGRAAAQNTARALVPDPAWNCGMPEGIPSPESGRLVFTISMELADVFRIGKTPYGDRRVAVVRSGKVTGGKLAAEVMTGALDLELTLSNGVIEIEQLTVLKAQDGKYIFLRAAGTGTGSGDVRVVMDFEAPNASDHAWLNSGKYVARRVLDEAAKTLTMRVYEVADVPAKTGSADVIRIVKPAGAPSQPWDARKKGSAEKPGRELITESVTLSPSQTVGASKHGNRNIIPITGGELKGRITGKVLAGGADYQNLSPPAIIDARYLWRSDDGEVILIRNAGPFGALVPQFEARTDGPHAWLNSGLFLSSNPSPSNGGVGITMYESTS